MAKRVYEKDILNLVGENPGAEVDYLDAIAAHKWGTGIGFVPRLQLLKNAGKVKFEGQWYKNGKYTAKCFLANA